MLKLTLVMTAILTSGLASADVPYTFEAGSKAKAAEVNANFSALTEAIGNLQATMSAANPVIDSAGLRQKDGVVKARKGLNASDISACQESDCSTYYTETAQVEGDYTKRIYIWNESWRTTEYWNNLTGRVERSEAGPVDSDQPMVRTTWNWVQVAPSEIKVGDSWFQSGSVVSEQDYDQDGTFEAAGSGTISEVIKILAMTDFTMADGSLQKNCIVIENMGSDYNGAYSHGFAVECPGLGQVEYHNANWSSYVLSVADGSTVATAVGKSMALPKGVMPTPTGLVATSR